MKKILRFTLLFVFVLISTNQLLGNLIFHQPPTTIIKVAFIVAIFEIVLKPIIKILLLPINLLTLGLFRIVINTLGLFLATFLLADFEVGNINSPAQNFWGVSIPPIHLTGFIAYLATSVTISLTFNLFRLILTKSIKK